MLNRILALSGLLASATSTLLLAQQPDPATRIRVVDATSGAPIAGVHVTVPELYLFWITDARGYAVIRGIPASDYEYEVTMPGYRPATGRLQMAAENRADVEVRLTVQPIELAGVTATVESTPVHLRWSRTLDRSGFYLRASMGVGHHLDRIQIEDQNALFLSDLFRMMPGVRLGYQDGEFYLADGGCGSLGGNGRMRIFVDGVRWAGNLDDLPVTAVEGLEVYTRLSQVPLQYSSTAVSIPGAPEMNDGCGVVLIWTG